MDREAWHAAVQGATKSWTWLSDWTEGMMTLTFSGPCDCNQLKLPRPSPYMNMHILSSKLSQNVSNFACDQSSSVQFSRSILSDSLRPHGPQHARPPVSHQLPEFTQTHVCGVGDAIQPSHPLSSPLPLLPSIFSRIRVFSNDSALHIRWPRYWSFSFNISPSNEHPGLISFKMDWLDLLAVQGTLKSSSPTPQFKDISSLALSFLYSPTLTSINDYW